jgi:hypothetical protein
MGVVGIGLVGGRHRGELVICPAMATKTCRRLRGVVRRILRMASAAGEVSGHMLVDEESVSATWSGR